MKKAFVPVTAPMAALLLLAAALPCFGGGNSAAGSSGEKRATPLRLVFYGDMTPRREEFFKKDFHGRVLGELNADLTVETLPWGSANTIVPTMLATGEKFAVYNIVSAFDWPSKGYLAEIDEALVRERLPDLIRARGPNNGFECVKYEGKIYAIPFGNKPYAGTQMMFTVRDDLLKQVGLDAGTITTYDQFMNALASVHAKYPNMRMNRVSGFLPTALLSEISDQLFFEQGIYFTYVNELEPGDRVYSFYESDLFKKLCAITAQWAKLGYIQMDEITNPTQGEADWNAGNCFMMYGVAGSWIDTSLKTAAPNAELKVIKLGDKPLVKLNDYDWGLSVSASDKDNVPLWLDLFNWVYKTQENYNYCVYGVEGRDWNRAPDGSIGRINTNPFFDEWFLQAMPYVTFDPSISKTSIERYLNNDNGSILSKRSGFNFNSAPVSSELAMMTAVYNEMLRPMVIGFLDYNQNYTAALQRLRSAGLDKYVAEYQRQFSAWYAAKSKK